jgi:hypothetical protein
MPCWLDSQGGGVTADRVNDVMELVEGFASAYGLELLATVHWAAIHELGTREADPAALTELIRNWSERKGRLFTEVHIRRAAEHLGGVDPVQRGTRPCLFGRRATAFRGAARQRGAGGIAGTGAALAGAVGSVAVSGGFFRGRVRDQGGVDVQRVDGGQPDRG